MDANMSNINDVERWLSLEEIAKHVGCSKDQLHTYTIVDAINDKNVLPFRVDYIKTMDTDADIDDEQVESV